MRKSLKEEMAKQQGKNADIFEEEGQQPPTPHADVDGSLPPKVETKQPKPAPKVYVPVGAAVQFFADAANEENPWAAIVTRVKPDAIVDIVVFRSDGQTLRYYDIPHRGKQKMGVWDFI